MIELVTSNFKLLVQRRLLASKSVTIVSPSVSMVTIEMLLASPTLQQRMLITRYSLFDFHIRLSDLKAISKAVDAGVEIYGIRHLHSKIYLFDDNEVLIGSPNFTYGGLERNHECAILTTDAPIVRTTLAYCAFLKMQASTPLASGQCTNWQSELDNGPQVDLKASAYSDYGALTTSAFGD